jgi:succinate dehydrogenase / fumarate reductase, iron-sulfur subunit
MTGTACRPRHRPMAEPPRRSASGAATAALGQLTDYTTEISEGMVVLDAMHQIQAESARRPRRALELQGRQMRLLLRRSERHAATDVHDPLSDLDLSQPVTVEPMRAFPPLRDLVTDVSWNFEVKKRMQEVPAAAPDAPDGTWRMAQSDVDRVQEFRKCIECYLCQDVCHVLRDHHKHDSFIGPRFLVYVAALEMHPLDVEDRVTDLRREHGIGFCNITKCCTNVCPENITITDNAIIPLKERVVDRHYDPLGALVQLVRGRWGRGRSDRPEPVRDEPSGSGRPNRPRYRGSVELKPIAREAIPRALQKAERYRLLKQPWAAESICLDVLAVEPGNQEALVSLVLAISDQLTMRPLTLRRARELLPGSGRCTSGEYYAGILAERRALAELQHGAHGSGTNAYEWLLEAMEAYQRAERWSHAIQMTQLCGGTPAYVCSTPAGAEPTAGAARTNQHSRTE